MDPGDTRASRSRTAAHQINKDVIRHEMNSMEPVRVGRKAKPLERLNKP